MTLHPHDGIQVAAEEAVGIFDAVSPDLRWLACSRDDTTSRVATKALYIEAVAPTRGGWHVASRGSQPRWRADGAELYYLADDRRLMAVRVGGRDSIEIGPSAALFETAAIEASGLEGLTYDVAPDGQRFLIKVPVEPAAIVVLANWKSLLETARRRSAADRG